jgi:hypothetical protein
MSNVECKVSQAGREFTASKTKKPLRNQRLVSKSGGSGEIRTHERLTPSAVFKTAAYALKIKLLA